MDSIAFAIVANEEENVRRKGEIKMQRKILRDVRNPFDPEDQVWLDYIPIGRQISGTRFIAFKVPLKKHIAESVQKEVQLTCDLLLEKIPNLGLVIDLTNTNRYYDSSELTNRGIRYAKLMIPGHNIPPEHLIRAFKRIVWDFLEDASNNLSLIGVHCTHGVNRTGYLICNFMVSELQFRPDDALKRFQEARGHQIERKNYRDHLREQNYQNKFKCAKTNYSKTRFVSPRNK